MALALIRRLIKGTPLTAAEHDGNLNVLEAAIAASLQPGQAIPSDVECRNNSGAGFTVGAPVYIVSSSGTKPTVALADASSEATAARSLGLVVATVNNNADCVVRTHGILTGINTSTLTEGAAIWLSETTGQLTSTRPTQPAHGVFFGFCVKQAAGTAGILYISVINGQELDELHDVLISSAAEGQVLRRASDGLWKNHTLTPGDVGAQPLNADLTAIAALATASFGRGLLTVADAAAARTAIGAGTSNVAISTATPQAPGTPAAGGTGQAADAGHVHALPGVVSTTTAGLAPATGTPTGKYLKDDGTWAGVPSGGTTPAGTATEIQYRNGTALGAIPSSAVDGTTGGVTLARLLLTANGAASTSPLALTGTWFTGGTTTTTKPQVLIEPTGTVSTSWSTAGTGLGLNAPNGFTGNLLDLQVNGSRILRVDNFAIYGSGSEYLRLSSGFSFWAGVNHQVFINAAGFGIRSFLGGGTAAQVYLVNDAGAAETLAQRNGANAQTFRVYNTYTSDTNFERSYLRWASNILRIGTEKGSGGGTARDMELQTDGTTRITLKANGAIIFTGLPTTDPAVTGQLWNDGGTLKISA